MLGLLHNFLPNGRGGGGDPIGVDLGDEAVRLVQTRGADRPALLAAASRDVPTFAREDPAAWTAFLSEALRELTREAGFAGRRVVLGLPNRRQSWLHLRLPKMPAGETAEALRFEAEGKLPYPAAAAVLRHEVVGEVHTDDGPRQEVLVTAVPRAEVEAAVLAAERAKLDVVGVRATPAALRDGFGRLYGRGGDAEATFMFVDLGRDSTRVVIARGRQLRFGRLIPVGGRAIDGGDEAARLRRLRDEADVPAEGAPAAMTLADELDRCRRYHDAAAGEAAVERLVFVGDDAAGENLCRVLARRLGVAAQTGDLMTRLLKSPGAMDDAQRLVAAGVDRRRAMPEWSTACGLALAGAREEATR